MGAGCECWKFERDRLSDQSQLRYASVDAEEHARFTIKLIFKDILEHQHIKIRQKNDYDTMCFDESALRWTPNRHIGAHETCAAPPPTIYKVSLIILFDTRSIQSLSKRLGVTIRGSSSI